MEYEDINVKSLKIQELHKKGLSGIIRFFYPCFKNNHIIPDDPTGILERTEHRDYHRNRIPYSSSESNMLLKISAGIYEAPKFLHKF